MRRSRLPERRLPTLLDTDARRAIAARTQRLTAADGALWGTMDPPRMLAHLVDSFRMAYGELPVTPKDMPLARLAPVRWLILRVLPMPRNAPTVREIVERPARGLEEERVAFLALLERFPTHPFDTVPTAHPLFGPLSRDDWGTLAWKHIDHHLRQFGV
ncbi:MAG: DUF1569 domain-containing protein [Gemmatimonadales bacterium]|nr:DUF1569 domain-containing protein [Gemmatimonadales bacterium]